MTTGATAQLGLALPVQGELSGTWGDTVNNGITQYTNIAIAATLTLTGDGAVTLANTTGDSSASNITSTLSGAGTVTAQFAIVQVSGTTTTKVITGPSYSKTYVVDNASSYAVTFKASGQTGVSIAAGEKVTVFFNGTDYLKIAGTIANAAGSNTQIQFNNGGLFGASSSLTWDGTTLSSTQVNITGQGTLRLQDTTGGEYVGLRAPGTLSASYTLTWPADDGTSGQALVTDGSGVLSWSTAASGDVYGPGSSTDNAVARFDGTTGKLIQNGVVIISDTGAVTGVTDLTTTGNTTLGDASTDTVTVNGYIGVGGAGAASVGVYVTSSALTGVNQAGVLGAITGSSAATTAIRAVQGDPATAAAAFTCSDVSSFYANNGTKGAGSTITNKHGIFIADQNIGANNFGITSGVSSGTNKWNIYASGTAQNYFAGNVGIGSTSPAAKLDVNGSIRVGSLDALYFGGTTNYITGSNGLNYLILTTNGSERLRIDSSGNVGIGTSSPTNALSVTGNANITGNVTLGDATTDSVTVNGYIGVGGAASSVYGINVVSTALTGTSQVGVGSSITATSAATSDVYAFRSRPSTAAASFTAANVIGFIALNTGLGAGSTITNQHGFYIADQTNGTNNYGITSLVSSGTNKWNIYASGTADNYFAGSVGIGTSSPSTKLDVTAASSIALARFLNTTAPTLSNDTHAGEALFLRSGGTAGSGNVQAVLAFGKADGSSVRSGSAIASVQTTADADQVGIGFYTSTSTSSSQTLTQAMLIDASGNLGLGVTPSAWNGVTGIQSSYGALSGNITTNILNNAYYNGGWNYTSTGTAAFYQQTTGKHLWYTAPSGTAGTAITFTQALTLSAAGNLLLGGTSDPTSAAKAIVIYNGTAPTGNVAGGILYVESGALKYRGSSGTVTTLASA